MLYSSGKFLFVHIYKTGGTNVTKLLSDYEDDKLKNGVLHNHIAAKDLQTIIPDYDNIFKFAFVRNTWDWMVSHYFHVKQNTGHPDHKFVKACTFKNFLRWVQLTARKRSKNLPPHMQTIHNIGYRYRPPYYSFTDFLKDSDGNILVDYIGYTHKFQESMNDICNRLNISAIDTEKKHTRRWDKGKDYRVYYDDKDIEVVYKTFKDDIDWFGFKFGEDINE